MVAVMISINKLHAIDEVEDQLILDFQQHPVFARMNEISRAKILEILLQRRFLSLTFVPFYELALDALTDEPAKQVVRSLIREEYDSDDGLTHREHLVHDLLAVGATRSQILRAKASKATINVATELIETVLRSEEDEDNDLYQISILSTLRLAGEILVAVEYEKFWPHLQRLGLSAEKARGKNESKFYFPHMTHDSRSQRLGSDPAPARNHTHADVMTDRLRQRLMLASAVGLDACILAARRAQGIKKRFYDQWLTT
jgi:hypothetical protein